MSTVCERIPGAAIGAIPELAPAIVTGSSIRRDENTFARLLPAMKNGKCRITAKLRRNDGYFRYLRELRRVRTQGL